MNWKLNPWYLCVICPHFNCQKSYYDIGHICPIRTEISTHEHWDNVFILLFIWLAVIGFRQNYYIYCLILEILGAKCRFFSLYNQPKKENVYKALFPPPPQCSKTPLISEMCIYITNNLCKWGLGTRGGGDDLQTKNGGGPAYSTWNAVITNGKLHQWLTFW